MDQEQFKYKSNKKGEKTGKKTGEQTDHFSILIYVNKIENIITVKMKYYLELLTLENMKLLGTTKSKIIKDENCENVLYLLK